MPRGMLKRNNLTRETLLAIAEIGALTILAGTSPYFLRTLVRQYFKDKSKKLEQARVRKLRELEKRGLIIVEESENKIKVEISRLGKKIIRQFDIENMSIKKPAKWDGMWHVFIYDIPISKRTASNAFRLKIKELGLFPLQKSVWVSPYDCVDELDTLATIFEIDINKSLLYLRTKEIPKERELLKYFDL